VFEIGPTANSPTRFPGGDSVNSRSEQARHVWVELLRNVLASCEGNHTTA